MPLARHYVKIPCGGSCGRSTPSHLIKKLANTWTKTPAMSPPTCNPKHSSLTHIRSDTIQFNSIRPVSYERIVGIHVDPQIPPVYNWLLTPLSFKSEKKISEHHTIERKNSANSPSTCRIGGCDFFEDSIKDNAVIKKKKKNYRGVKNDWF